MAVSDASIEGVHVSSPSSSREFEHRFFFAVAVLYPLAVLMVAPAVFVLADLAKFRGMAYVVTNNIVGGV